MVKHKKVKHKDKVENIWRTRVGLPAVVVLGELGFRRGYVGVDRDNGLWGLEYNRERPRLGNQSPQDLVAVHGGLTYSRCELPVRIGWRDQFTFADVLGDIRMKDFYWFGFDCMHARDGVISGVGERKTMGYVAHECERLASQLQEYRR